MNKGFEKLEIVLFIHHETAAAILVSETNDRKKAIWLPKSQITIDGLEPGEVILDEEGEQMVAVEVPEWLALKKGLI